MRLMITGTVAGLALASMALASGAAAQSRDGMGMEDRSLSMPMEQKRKPVRTVCVSRRKAGCSRSFQRALKRLPSRGGTIVVPKGEAVSVSRVVRVQSKSVTICSGTVSGRSIRCLPAFRGDREAQDNHEAAAARHAILEMGDPQGCFAVSGRETHRIRFADIRFESAPVEQPGACLYADGVDLTLENVYFGLSGLTATGILMPAGRLTGTALSFVDGFIGLRIGSPDTNATASAQISNSIWRDQNDLVVVDEGGALFVSDSQFVGAPNAGIIVKQGSVDIRSSDFFAGFTRFGGVDFLHDPERGPPPYSSIVDSRFFGFQQGTGSAVRSSEMPFGDRLRLTGNCFQTMARCRVEDAKRETCKGEIDAYKKRGSDGGVSFGDGSIDPESEEPADWQRANNIWDSLAWGEIIDGNKCPEGTKGRWPFRRNQERDRERCKSYASSCPRGHRYGPVEFECDPLLPNTAQGGMVNCRKDQSDGLSLLGFDEPAESDDLPPEDEWDENGFEPEDEPRDGREDDEEPFDDEPFDDEPQHDPHGQDATPPAL